MGQVRYQFLLGAPDAELGAIDFVRNRTCREISLVIKLLKPAQVKEYFGINKKQRLYLCPGCFSDASHKWNDFDYKLAVLRPNSATSRRLYCPICNVTFKVARDDCYERSCSGNVISEEYGLCLTCGAK